MSLLYRREIDGLRAVAVTPVILFHAGLSLFSGGFVGVDVFFVISGYLITGLLIGDLSAGRFSILDFYRRRARRILPALFFVMACCIPLAWAWMLPEQFEDFGRSVLAVTVFASNILFWRQSGYFAAAAEEKPLLHTWSLAVEEQFYIFFPIFLFLLWRFGRRSTFWVIAACAGISLAAAQWASSHSPAANFYLLPSRAFELFAGALCAFRLNGRGPYSNGGLAALGLVMIVGAVFLFNARTPFPSLYALVPVGGAVLVILFGGADTLVTRLLSSRAFVGVGLISYSAYLWHQPLFAFARIRSLKAPDEATFLLLAALSLVLALLSWRFVEQPFRRPGPRPSLGVRVALTSAGVAVFLGFGAFALAQHGAPQRLPPSSQVAAKAAMDRNPLRKTCVFHDGTPLRVHPVSECLADPGRPPTVAILGDSHADAISYPIQQSLLKAGINSYSVQYAGCIPFKGLHMAQPRSAVHCQKFLRAFDAYAQAAGIDTIILAARWTRYWNGDPYDNGEGGVETGGQAFVDVDTFQGPTAPAEDPARRARVLKQYKHGLMDWLDRYTVVLVYPIPEAGWNVPSQVTKRYMFRTPSDVDTNEAAFWRRNQPIIDMFDSVDSSNLRRVQPSDVLCGVYARGRCANTHNGNIFYYDDDHLSNTGARLLIPAILDQLGVERRQGDAGP